MLQALLASARPSTSAQQRTTRAQLPRQQGSGALNSMADLFKPQLPASGTQTHSQMQLRGNVSQALLASARTSTSAQHRATCAHTAARADRHRGSKEHG